MIRPLGGLGFNDVEEPEQEEAGDVRPPGVQVFNQAGADKGQGDQLSHDLIDDDERGVVLGVFEDFFGCDDAYEEGDNSGEQQPPRPVEVSDAEGDGQSGCRARGSGGKGEKANAESATGCVTQETIDFVVHGIF